MTHDTTAHTTARGTAGGTAPDQGDRGARRRRIVRRTVSLAATALLAGVAAAGIGSGFDISDPGPSGAPPTSSTPRTPGAPHTPG